MAALAAAVPRHPSWKGWIRASAKASSSSLGRAVRRLLFLLFGASADSLQNRMGKAYIRFCRQNYSLCYTNSFLGDFCVAELRFMRDQQQSDSDSECLARSAQYRTGTAVLYRYRYR